MSEREHLASIVYQSRAIGDTPDETGDIILATGYRRVSADPDTVERAAKGIGVVSLNYGGPGWEGADDEQREALRGMARAAINAIGGGDG